VSDGDRVETFKGCAWLLLLYLGCCILTGAVIGLTVAGVAFLLSDGSNTH
jgi:hypothetical protein